MLHYVVFNYYKVLVKPDKKLTFLTIIFSLMNNNGTYEVAIIGFTQFTWHESD